MKTEEEQKWENAMRDFLVRNNPTFSPKEIENAMRDLFPDNYED